ALTGCTTQHARRRAASGSSHAGARADPVSLEDLVRHFAQLLGLALDVAVVPIMLGRKHVARERLVATRDLELVADLFTDRDRAHEVVDGFDLVAFAPGARAG